MTRILSESYEIGFQTYRAVVSGGLMTSTAGLNLNGTYCLNLANSGITYLNAGSDPDLYISFFLRFYSVGAVSDSSDASRILNLIGVSGTEIGSLRFNGITAHLTLRVGSLGAATLVATGTTSLSADTTYHVQLRHKVANAGGVFELYLNGILEATFTGDTQPGSDTYADRLDFRGQTFGHAFYIDDVLVNNSLGAAENTYTGINRIAAALVPTGPGFYVNNWSRNTGTTNWQAVDEVPPDGDTTYLFTTTPNLYESFSMSDQALVNVNYKALMTSAVVKKDSGTVQLAVGFRDVQNATNYYGANSALGVSYGVVSARNTVDPTTGLPWTSARLNSVEALIVSTTG